MMKLVCSKTNTGIDFGVPGVKVKVIVNLLKKETWFLVNDLSLE
jgi:hypothetical protein